MKMVTIQFVGSAAEVLAEMRLLAFVEPLVPLPEVIKAVAAPEPEREPELPGLEAQPLPVEPDPAPAPELAPPRKRRTKEEMAAARAASHSEGLPKAEAAALDADAAKLEAMGQDAGPTVGGIDPPAVVAYADLTPDKPLTFEDVKEALKELCEADGLGVEAAQALLKKFGVSRLSLLDASRWNEFYGAALGMVGK